MKNLIRIYSLLLVVMLGRGLNAFAGVEDPVVEKSKTYSKSYAIGSDKVVLENSFGELQINNWSNDEIKVEITITVNAVDDKRAQALLDAIRIEDHKRNGEVYFKTNIDDRHENSVHHQNGNDGKHNNENFKVNYVVHMPASPRLRIKNSFGATVIGDYNGPVSITSSFGSLKAGKMKQNEGIQVEFGNAVIESVDGGKVTFKFGQGEIRNMSGDVDLSFEFNGMVKVNMTNEVRSLHVKNNYGKLYIKVPQNLSAGFNVRSNMGTFKNETAFAINEDKNESDTEYGPRMMKTYSGKVGGGNSTVKVENEFGKVIFSHDVVFDGVMKKKTESKTEHDE